MVHLGFIGTGHIGSMLIRKFIETGVAAPGDIIASNGPEKRPNFWPGI
jgi:pyrroline-5-carboxylate reductase